MGLSFQDPHQELKGKNVLIVRYSLELTAARFGLEPGRLGALLREGRQRLSAARAQRPRPHLDTKMLAAWNGETWLSSGDACLDRTPSAVPRASRVSGARSDESCWDRTGPHRGSGWAGVQGGGRKRGDQPHTTSRGAAECQDVALALFSSPVASREQQNSSPGSARLPWLGSGEGD